MPRVGAGLSAWLLVLLLPIWLAAAAPPALAQAADFVGMMGRITDLTKAGKLTEAIALGRRLVAEAEKAAGKDHPLTISALSSLSQLYILQGQLDEAEAMLKRVLAVRERTLGPGHVDVAATLATLASVAVARARYAEAESLLQRALAIRERGLGPDHFDTAMTRVWLGRIRHAQARYSEAETLFERALSALRKSQGLERMAIGTVLNNLAVVFQDQGLLTLAEPRLREALALQEQQFGQDSFAIAPMINNLAQLLLRQGRYAEAEALQRRALQISEKALRPDHPDIAFYLANLATVFSYQGRASDAEGLQRRALAIEEKALGPHHPNVAARLNNLAFAVDAQGRHQEAEALYRRSLAMREAIFGPEHDSVALSLANLAGVLYDQDHFAEAVPLAQRALQIREKLLGAQHPQVADSLNLLGLLLDNVKRHSEAEPLLKRALAIREAVLGDSHPDTAVTVHNLASHYADLRDWPAAYAGFKRAYAMWLARRSLAAGKAEEGRVDEERVRSVAPYLGLVAAAYRMADGAPTDTGLALRAETFESAQWSAGASATAAVSRMAARFAAGGGQLGDLVRERQDLAEQAFAADRALIALMSQAPARRAAGADAALRRRADSIARRLKQVDADLGKRFPQYTALTTSGPVGLPETAALLGPREALLLFAPTREGTYLWAITRDASRWVEIPLGSEALDEHVAALRCGLDAVGAWDSAGTQRCMALLKLAAPPRETDPRPFDAARAYALYRALLGPVEDLIAGKELLIVPAGSLASIPFHALVTDAPHAGSTALTSGSELARVAWLARRHAISVLPSVASLQALRRLAPRSQAKTPFIGFGNPLLTGVSGTDRRAWERLSCQPAPKRMVVAPSYRERGTPKGNLLRRGLARVEDLQRQPPLPETVDELCTVARLLGAPEASVHLGPGATEREVKELSARGVLRDVRLVHFATHGLLASEAESLLHIQAEPALLLTPPSRASEEDDGLLTATEVAQLKLDADWVILSACNTAAGDALGAEALSGLARAFFYAGSRALLASHWYVDSEATVALITGVFAELKAHPEAGRAAALQRAMLALIDRGGPGAHPSAWAPFVVVGDGGR